MSLNSRGLALHRPSRNLPGAQLKMAHTSKTAVVSFVQVEATDAGFFHMQLVRDPHQRWSCARNLRNPGGLNFISFRCGYLDEQSMRFLSSSTSTKLETIRRKDIYRTIVVSLRDGPTGRFSKTPRVLFMLRLPFFYVPIETNNKNKHSDQCDALLTRYFHPGAVSYTCNYRQPLHINN